MGINFKIDKSKCIHCGQCVKDCVAGIVKLNKSNIPFVADENRCIKCQHCLAVCPTGAISILDKYPENSEPIIDNFNDTEILNLIKSRRSCRQYKPENLPKETIDKLKNMLKYPPTGCNFHKLHISIVDDIETMDNFRQITLDKMRKLCSKNPKGKFAEYKEAFINGEDIIYRDAPHMIVVSVPINAPCAPEDVIINLTSFELYAQSLGVGTLWCGYGQLCLKLFPDLCKFLEIPDGYKPGYVLLFGAPDVKYHRCTQPNDYQIISVSNKKEIHMNIIEKIKRYFWNFIRG